MQKLLADCMVAASAAMVELMEEDKEEEDKEADIREGSSTVGLAPKQAPEPWAAMLVAPVFCAAGPSNQVASIGLAASLKAWGKAPAIQVELLLLVKTAKELAR